MACAKLATLFDYCSKFEGKNFNYILVSSLWKGNSWAGMASATLRSLESKLNQNQFSQDSNDDLINPLWAGFPDLCREVLHVVITVDCILPPHEPRGVGTCQVVLQMRRRLLRLFLAAHICYMVQVTSRDLHQDINISNLTQITSKQLETDYYKIRSIPWIMMPWLLDYQQP